MRIDVGAITDTPAERAYVEEIQRRVKSGRRQVLTRVGGIQASWTLVLIAGAAIPVVEVVGLPRWVAGVLGFVIVVFQGVERMFARTADGFRPLDVMRRSLDRELRLFALERHDPTTEPAPFSDFVDRCEQLIATYDAADIDYYQSLTTE